MSIVDLPALSPHCASGYKHSASDRSVNRTTRAKAFPIVHRGVRFHGSFCSHCGHPSSRKE